jgi:serine/threonine protein kinase
MEFMAGGDLARRFENPPRYGLNDKHTVKVIGLQVARGLQHIHAMQIIHRDIKVLRIPKQRVPNFYQALQDQDISNT